MSNCSDHKNPLHNTGTSQPQRLLPGLDKNQFALVDEKEFADWIVFAKEFAAFINYYDQSNKVAGNWQPFFAGDISAQLGSIAIQNIDRFREDIKERFDFIKNDENKTSVSEIEIKLNELFSALLTLSAALDYYLLKLPDTSSLKSTIQNLIETKFATALTRLIAYYKAAGPSALDFLDSSSLSNWQILNKPLTDAGAIISDAGLSSSWYDDSLFPDFKTSANSIQADDSIFQNPLTGITDEFLSIEHAANHNLFTGIFDTYLSGYTKVIKEAEDELLTTLENYDHHTPHYALFLSFLKLYRFIQENLSTITQRHLDFYYKEVLRLQPKAAEANKVHVLGELAKQVDSYLLVQNTALKAGKDSTKKEVIYTLDKDAVFNKAKVSQLKTFYKAVSEDSFIDPLTGLLQDNTNRVFASPISNSDDGLNPALTSPNKEWQPFVHKVFKDAVLESIAMPKAVLGFALASHYLYLTEGERKVFIRFVLSDNSILNGKSLKCYLTAEKEWYKVDSVAIASNKLLSDHDTNCAEISFTIPGSAPPIVNYDASKHGGTFNVSLPMLKIILVNKNDSAYEYDSLKNTTLTKVEIRVEVGNETGYNQNGLKNLLLSNDFGEIDASKPFMPFGGQPEKDNGFVIGHKEIFSKKNAAIKLNVEWAGLPDSVNSIMYETNSSTATTPECVPQILADGKWLSNGDNNSIPLTEPLFNDIASEVILFSEGQFIPESAVSDYQEEYNPLNSATLNGFIRLSLKSSFGYKAYIRDLALYLIEKSPDISDTINSQPIEPYTPKIKSIYADYAAYCINDLTDTSVSDEREIFFFHLYPFGDSEQNLANDSNADKIFLLPQFNHSRNGITLQHVGEFYIGIENLNPDESVNILFQVMQGTSNPKVVKPADHILWSFLSDNHWVDFNQSEISDNTLALVQSGIISFAIPKEATKQNTMLPAGYIWLRASVSEAAEAVCKIITVDAQAAVATFANNNNAPDFLDSPLPAGTISKLAIPDAAIKKIVQPYSSFGGRATESDGQFYIRVSERLRHKNRAITVWDYEHMVLEAFPEIYKVKCLNHTQIEEGVYHEVRPGYVSIITIPSQINRNDANPLKPYTQQSTLTNIENFLQKRISCFVKLRASQPQFEEIRLEFSLKLFDQYQDFTFYSNLLKDEITKFLSPWAYGNSSTIDFGGKVYKSVLINFIEERYYVDFITDVLMFVKVDDTTNESGDIEEITASTARSILVSAPASTHLIHEIVLNNLTTPEVCIDKNNNQNSVKNNLPHG